MYMGSGAEREVGGFGEERAECSKNGKERGWRGKEREEDRAECGERGKEGGEERAERSERGKERGGNAVDWREGAA